MIYISIGWILSHSMAIPRVYLVP